MPRFRKKPVEIDAVSIHSIMSRAYGNAVPCEDWVEEALNAEPGTEGRVIVLKEEENDTPPGIVVCTLEGDMHGEPNDWLLRGVKGELYPCKPDIFEATYVPAAETLPDVPEEAWRGQPPAEGTRRWHIFEAIRSFFRNELADETDGTALLLADDVEAALLSAAAQPVEDDLAGAEAIEANEAGES
jgi:hypothetical protein